MCKRGMPRVFNNLDVFGNLCQRRCPRKWCLESSLMLKVFNNLDVFVRCRRKWCLESSLMLKVFNNLDVFLQVPKGVVSRELFDPIHTFIIAKKQLQNSFISL